MGEPDTKADDDTKVDDTKVDDTKVDDEKPKPKTRARGDTKERDKARLRPVVEELLEELLGDDDDDAGDDDTKVDDEKPRGRTARDVEDMSRDRVRAAVAELDDERALRKDVADLKEKVTEAAPRQVNRLQRWLWGDK